MSTDPQSSPFIKHLASSGTLHPTPKQAALANPPADKKTRDQALTSLRTFLSGRSEISELDLLKLWKGLFYCTWYPSYPSRHPTYVKLAINLMRDANAPFT
jgi:ribosomal RNA-processing protein 1